MREKTASRKLVAFFALLFAAVALMVLATGCAGGESTTSEETTGTDTANTVTPTGTLENNTLVVGVNSQPDAPSVWQENGQYTGIDVDLATEACKRLGWELRFQPIQWDQMAHDIQDGVATCVWSGLTITEAREQVFTFSEPYMKSDFVVALNLDNNDITSLSDLVGKRVATLAGSSMATLIENNQLGIGTHSMSDGTLQLTNSIGLAFNRLAAGACDAVITDLPTAEYYIAGGDNIAITDTTGQTNMAQNEGHFKLMNDPSTDEPEVIYEAHDGIAFNLGEQALANDVSNALYEMYVDGTVKTILDKYTEYDVTIDDWILTQPVGETATTSDSVAAQAEKAMEQNASNEQAQEALEQNGAAAQVDEASE